MASVVAMDAQEAKTWNPYDLSLHIYLTAQVFHRECHEDERSQSKSEMDPLLLLSSR